MSLKDIIYHVYEKRIYPPRGVQVKNFKTITLFQPEFFDSEKRAISFLGYSQENSVLDVNSLKNIEEIAPRITDVPTCNYLLLNKASKSTEAIIRQMEILKGSETSCR